MWCGNRGLAVGQSCPRRKKFNENRPFCRNRYRIATSAPQVGKVKLKKYEKFNKPEDNDHIRDG